VHRSYRAVYALIPNKVRADCQLNAEDGPIGYVSAQALADRVSGDFAISYCTHQRFYRLIGWTFASICRRGNCST